MGSLITTATTAIKCPDGLEAMRIHLGFLDVGLGVVRAIGWEETDDVVEVGLARCQHLMGNLLRLGQRMNQETHVNGTL